MILQFACPFTENVPSLNEARPSWHGEARLKDSRWMPPTKRMQQAAQLLPPSPSSLLWPDPIPHASTTSPLQLHHKHDGVHTAFFPGLPSIPHTLPFFTHTHTIASYILSMGWDQGWVRGISLVS